MTKEIIRSTEFVERDLSGSDSRKPKTIFVSDSIEETKREENRKRIKRGENDAMYILTASNPDSVRGRRTRGRGRKTV